MVRHLAQTNTHALNQTNCKIAGRTRKEHRQADTQTERHAVTDTSTTHSDERNGKHDYIAYSGSTNDDDVMQPGNQSFEKSDCVMIKTVT